MPRGEPAYAAPAGEPEMCEVRVDGNDVVQTAIYVNLNNTRKTRGVGCLRICVLGNN